MTAGVRRNKDAKPTAPRSKVSPPTASMTIPTKINPMERSNVYPRTESLGPDNELDTVSQTSRLSSGSQRARPPRWNCAAFSEHHHQQHPSDDLMNQHDKVWGLGSAAGKRQLRRPFATGDGKR